MKSKMWVGIFLSILILMTSCTSNKDSSKDKLKLETKIFASEFKKYQTDEVIQSKYFEIHIVKDSVVPENFAKMCDIVAEDDMKITELKLYPDGDLTKNRIKINVQREHRASLLDEDTINITEEEAILWNGTSAVLAHELAHCIQYQNFKSYNRLIDEGYAGYIASLYYKVSTLPCCYWLHHMIAEYQLPDVSILEQTVAKKAIFSEDQPMMEYYGMGLRLVTFLQETYGKDTMTKLLKNLDSQTITKGTQITATIKEITSEDAFVKFADWNKINKDRMEKLVPLEDYSKTKTLYITPLRYEDVWNPEKGIYFYYYNNINGSIKKDLILDFSYGYKYFNLAENKPLTQFGAKFTSDKDCKLKLYDKDRNPTKTIEVKAGETVVISEKLTYYIKIEGECTFYFEPIWKDMLPSNLVLPDGMV